MFEIEPSRRAAMKARKPGFLTNFEGSFVTDIKETEDEFIMEAELPGLDKDDIDIQVDDNTLTISANTETTTEEESGSYIRRERRVQSFRRAFPINNVKIDEVVAEYDNGILKVNMPKKESGKTTKKRIEIS